MRKIHKTPKEIFYLLFIYLLSSIIAKPRPLRKSRIVHQLLLLVLTEIGAVLLWIIRILNIIAPIMRIMFIIHEDINTEIYFNNLNRRIILFSPVSWIIRILSIIAPIMRIMLKIHKTREKNFYPLFASTVCNAAINRPTVSLGSGEYIIPTGIV